MALIKQQDVILLQVARTSQVAETVKAHLDNYPSVRIISMQVISISADIHVFLVVETT